MLLSVVSWGRRLRRKDLHRNRFIGHQVRQGDGQRRPFLRRAAVRVRRRRGSVGRRRRLRGVCLGRGGSVRPDGRLRRHAPGEGYRAHNRRCRQSGQEGGALHFAALRNAGNPLLQPPLVGGHGGRRQQRVPGASLHGNQPQQGPPVRDPLLLPQRAQGQLVTGELAVLLGRPGRQPYQGVEPVYGQTYAPEQGPQGVPLPCVGLLVGQHVAQTLLILQGGGSQVDGGPEQPEEARGHQSLLHQIRRAPAALQLQGEPPAPQHPPEPQVGHDQPQGHAPHAAVPDGPEDSPQIDLPPVFGLAGHLVFIGDGAGIV